VTRVATLMLGVSLVAEGVNPAWRPVDLLMAQHEAMPHHSGH
jgi:hypothetical protein